MKKKIWIPIVIVLIAVLFIPIPSGVYKDGGTREYTALTYKIVKWNRLTGDSTYDKLCVYLFRIISDLSAACGHGRKIKWSIRLQQPYLKSVNHLLLFSRFQIAPS